MINDKCLHTTKYGMYSCMFFLLFVTSKFMNVTLSADFDLEKERSGLDEQGLKIAENQESSQKNRRKLAESTRGMFYYFLPA